MEYAVCGALYSYIVKHKRLEENEAAFFFTQLICGLEEIHKNNIVHRDIKPENLLLKENKVLTIIDFGLSNTYKHNQLLTTPCGSPCYAAPEMILNQKYKGINVDIWSSGIVLYAMICGYLPFEDQVTERVYQKIRCGRFELPDHLSKECRDIITRLLTVNPNKRITIEEIKSHPFLKLASPIYHIDENYYRKDYCEAVIDKMINNMPGFSFKREEIIFYLVHNKHNNITTTYELLLKKYKANNNCFAKSMSSKSNNFASTTSQQSISLNTTTSPLKASDDKMISNINCYPTITTSKDKRGLSVTIPKSSRGNYSRHNNLQYSNNITSHRRTLDNSKSNRSNDDSTSLDVSKIIKKNKIDSNIIIGIPKLVPVNKKIFAKLNYKNSNFYYKEIKALNTYYRKSIINATKNDINNSSRRFNKNNAINTSVTYEPSPYHFDTFSSNMSKNMKFIPSNTINLIEDHKKNKPIKSVIRYGSYKKKKNISSNQSSNSNVNSYLRSQSLNDSLNSMSSSVSGSNRKYLMTFTSDRNNNKISTSSLKMKSSHLFKTANISSIKHKHNENNKSIASDLSSIKKKNFTERRKKNEKMKTTSLKYSSPIPKPEVINRTSYCPSFTETTLPISLVEDKSNCKKLNTPVKKVSDITISIRKEINRHIKKDSLIRPLSPVSMFTKKRVKNKEKKVIKNQPVKAIGIDIAKEKKQRKIVQQKVPSSNSQKSIKTTKRGGSISSKTKTKRKHIHTKDIGIVDLSQPSPPKPSKKVPEIKFDLEKENEIKTKMLTSSKDFVLWTTSQPINDIISTIQSLCKENDLTLTEIDKAKFICKKDTDNSINIEICAMGENNNALKLYHLNGQESITKEIIKKIIKAIGL